MGVSDSVGDVSMRSHLSPGEDRKREEWTATRRERLWGMEEDEWWLRAKKIVNSKLGV